jgi:uncharacterized DUF497 family protein
MRCSLANDSWAARVSLHGGEVDLPRIDGIDRDTLYIQIAVRFEWDEIKSRANIAKHGIEFAAVAPVFSDPLSLTIPDRLTDGERRYRTIGAALNGVVLVAHTLREISGGGELIRVISARYATSSERTAYEEGEY